MNVTFRTFAKDATNKIGVERPVFIWYLLQNFTMLVDTYKKVKTFDKRTNKQIKISTKILKFPLQFALAESSLLTLKKVVICLIVVHYALSMFYHW